MAPSNTSTLAVTWSAKPISYGIRIFRRLWMGVTLCSLCLCHVTWRRHLASLASCLCRVMPRKCSFLAPTTYRRCLSPFPDRTPLMWCVMKIFTLLRCHPPLKMITKKCVSQLQVCLLQAMLQRALLYSQVPKLMVSINSLIDQEQSICI